MRGEGQDGAAICKFWIKLGGTASETLQMIRIAYGDGALCSVQVFRWYKAFKKGREAVEDGHRFGGLWRTYVMC
ncbi:hypothetical protein Trydic_g21411 [Trypoxylus dichotomus]